MISLRVLGILLFVFGLLFCVAPGFIVRLNQWGKRLVFTDEGTLKHNVKAGVIFMVVGLIIFILNWRYWPRY